MSEFDKKISQLTGGGASQAADEYVINRGGANYKITGANVAAAATSLGTIAGLTMTGNLTIDTDVVVSRGSANRLDLASGDSLNLVSGSYKIAGTDVLSSNTLGSGVTASSLTSVGTLSSLTVSGTAGPIGSFTTSGSGTVAKFATTSGNTYGEIQIAGSSRGGQLEFLNGSTRLAGIYADASNNMFFVNGTGDTERMKLDASGNLAVDTNTLYVDATNNNVGIGTSSPNSTAGFTTLTINNATTGGIIDLQSNGTLVGRVYNNATNFYLYNQTSNPLIFGTGGSEKMRLDSSGNLGLGVTPSAWSALKGLQIEDTAVFVGHASSEGAWVGSNAYFNGSAWKRIGAGYANLLEFGSGVFKFNTAGTSTADSTITFTQAMTLDASGNLVIGGTTASSRFDVQWATTSNALAYFQNTSDGNTGITLKNSGREYGIFVNGGSGSSNALRFYDWTASAERARITSGGYFKASNDGTYNNATGTFHELRQSTNETLLLVQNTSSTLSQTVNGIQVSYNGASPNGTSASFLYCGDSTALRASIRSNGGLANYQANNVDLSDARTKTDITPLDSMWGKVAALEIVSYKYIDQTHDDVNLGVIAQQVETVEPVWVDSDGFGETPEGEEPMKSVYNKDIYFAAIKALQEAMARIEALEVEVAALKGGA